MTKRDFDDPVAYMPREFTRQGGLIASRLRQAADDVERHAAGVRVNLQDLKLDHGRAAEEIVHDLQSMFANLPLGALLHAAAEADRYVRDPEEGDSA